jgi:hypothetical protein
MKTFLGCLLIVGNVVSAVAHPVAQGALDIQIEPQSIRVQARVSNEEIFVANAFHSNEAPEVKTLPEVWARHGQYLLKHLRVSANQKALSGKMLEVAPSERDCVVYSFEFTGVSSPSELRIEEDVLTEIEYVPGNPWEASYFVRIQQQDRLLQEGLLLSHSQPIQQRYDWADLAACESGSTIERVHIARQYIQHGIGHILSGYDHLLFIAALVLATATFWDLLKVVTAFTLAHTVTLTLSVLDVVRLPSHIVEPMIAGSIVFVAITNVFWPEYSRGRMRLGTAFFFGLFHGLGFAGGLLDATQGMHGVVIGLAIAAFSLGVELGHQMIVLPLFFGLKLARSTQREATGSAKLSLRMTRSGSALICVAGMIYLVAALR